MASSGARFAIMLGDNVVDADNTSHWDYFGKESSPLLSTIPVYNVQGNHDYTWPPGLFRNDYTPYSFDSGEAHILLAPTGTAQWVNHLPAIEADLKNTSKKWKIVAMHKPRYTSGDHYEEPDIVEVRERLTPLFMKHGVDLVLSAHAPQWERTDLNGTIGITTGGTSVAQFGANLSDADYYSRYGISFPPPYVMYRTFQHLPNFAKVTITNSSLLVEGIDGITGAVFDSIVLTKPN